jgi:hypothetical protein
MHLSLPENRYSACTLTNSSPPLLILVFMQNDAGDEDDKVMHRVNCKVYKVENVLTKSTKIIVDEFLKNFKFFI